MFLKVNEWTRDYFLANQEICLEKLENLTSVEQAEIIENFNFLENNSLVQVSGFLADTLEPEFYCEKVVIKSNNGTERIECGKFTDKLKVNEDEVVSDDNNYQHLHERFNLLIAQPKSTNQWVLDSYPKINKQKRKVDEPRDITEPVLVKVCSNNNQHRY